MMCGFTLLTFGCRSFLAFRGVVCATVVAIGLDIAVFAPGLPVGRGLSGGLCVVSICLVVVGLIS